MDQAETLRKALQDVPDTLLTSAEQRVLADATISLDVAQRSEAVRPLVAIVGPSGVGKSFVFNRLVRAGASPEGVLRPTTASVVVAGTGDEPYLRAFPEYVHVDASDDGFAVADTLAWEHDPESVSSVARMADLVVAVVSPSRYADESFASLWDDLAETETVVILNRVGALGSDRSELLASVTEVYGCEPFIVAEGDENVPGLADFVRQGISSEKADAMRLIMNRTASAGARFVVRAATNAAPDIGKVHSAVEGLGIPSDYGNYDVQSSWEGTRDGIVEQVDAEVRRRDDEIVAESGTEFANRMFDTLGPWDESVLASSLDDWRQRCTDSFTEAASIRWRRANALQLIERFAWKVAINDAVVAPRRFSRIMGDQLREAVLRSRSDLDSLVRSTVLARAASWTDALEELGSFQPGGLMAAADALVGTGQDDD